MRLIEAPTKTVGISAPSDSSSGLTKALKLRYHETLGS